MSDIRLIDFHSHILPNIDDGARNIDEAYEMLKEARDSGFSGIVLSSHYIENFYDTEHYGRKVWFEILKEKFSDFDQLKLYLASEIYLSNKIIDQLSLYKASTLNNTSYILIDIDQDKEMIDIYDLIEKMLKNRLIPIICHPEKCLYIRKNPNILADYIKKGAYVQANYGSFIRMYGNATRKCAITLLQNNMVHFLGTDSHRPNCVYPNMKKIIKEIETLVGRRELEILGYENPKNALLNKRIVKKEPQEVELSFFDKSYFYVNNLISFRK